MTLGCTSFKRWVQCNILDLRSKDKLSEYSRVMIHVGYGRFAFDLLFCWFILNATRAFRVLINSEAVVEVSDCFTLLVLLLKNDAFQIIQLIANILTLNIKRKNFDTFCPAQRKLTFQPNITIFDNDNDKYVPLECKEFVKCLGIFMKQNLTCWKHHIDHVAFKISRYAGILSKLRPNSYTNNHLSLYHFTTFNLWLVSLGSSL